MNAAKTITANFTTDVPRTLNVTVAGMGSVVADPAQPTYLTGSSVAVTAVPDPGWAFNGWSGDLAGLANPETVVINTDKYITATFSEIPPAILADDFDACDLDPMWTVVDPYGDGGTAAIVDAYTGSARVAISVPGGNEHEIWNGWIGATHILQAAANTDFTLEAKFDSDLQDIGGQMGILIKESQARWIRVEFYRAADGYLRSLMTVGPAQDVLNVIIPDNVVAPLYVRVVRTGDTFTQYWSDNHENWYLTGTYPSYPMTVTGVGLYAGNRGLNAPAHTVLVDYLSNTLNVPPAEDAARNDLTVTVVGQGAVGRLPDLPDYDCGAPVELTATPALGWAFDSWSGDLVGNANPATVTMDGPLNVTANFVAIGASAVFANASGVLGLSTTRTCETGIPVEILRNGAENMRAFSATVNLAGLALCNGVASIQEGTYLNSQGATSFLVTDNLDGTYDVDGTIVGTPCGATAPTGVLFTIEVTNTIADGTGSISLTGLDIRDCDGVQLAASPGVPANIPIDSTPPANVTSLAATQALSGNPAGNSTAVGLAWTASVDGTAVQTVLFRKAFGGYPEYDDNGGAAPAVPVNPAAEGWALVASLPSTANSFSDLAGARDYWYYCAVSEDALGNRSTSLVTTGTLNYLLGDMSDGGVPVGDGDNRLDTADVSLLGNSYGTIDGDALYVATLDVGPTHNNSVFGRPTTDSSIGFEDLILVSINFGLDATVPALPASLLALASAPPAPAERNAVSLDIAALPAVGQTFAVDLAMLGDGTVQAMQVALVWDDNVLEVVGYQGGPLLTAQGGPSVVLSGAVGVIDIGLIGVRESGISGAGVVATATFRVIGTGVPGLQIAAIDARSNVNGNVPVGTDTVSGVGDVGLPQVSALYAAYPNPFNPMTTISFDLARPGHVRVSIFGVDGRLVRTLVDDNFVAGRHDQVWTGRDDAGRAVASGVYFYRMVGPGIEQTQRMLLVK
jgi:regulation of enolase protein 1 (concanavalin A-like superfamily)